MNKVIYLFFCLLLIGCESIERPTKVMNEDNVPIKLDVGNNSYNLSEWEYKGHTYLILSNSVAGGLTHAGHCKCFTNRGTRNDSLVRTSK